MPSLLCNGAITTTSASESVEIGKNGVSAIFRISSGFATLRLEGVGQSTTATGWSIQRSNNTNSTTVMLGTIVYQTCANNLNIFSKDVSITGNATITGNLSVNGTFTNSDENIKTNIENLSQKDAIYMLKHLNPKIYDRTDIISNNEIGFIAQEAKKTLPLNWCNVVHDSDDGLLQLDYAKLTPILWSVCKNLLSRIEILEAKLNSN